MEPYLRFLQGAPLKTLRKVILKLLRDERTHFIRFVRANQVTVQDMKMFIQQRINIWASGRRGVTNIVDFKAKLEGYLGNLSNERIENFIVSVRETKEQAQSQPIQPEQVEPEQAEPQQVEPQQEQQEPKTAQKKVKRTVQKEKPAVKEPAPPSVRKRPNDKAEAGAPNKKAKKN